MHGRVVQIHIYLRVAHARQDFWRVQSNAPVSASQACPVGDWSWAGGVDVASADTVPTTGWIVPAGVQRQYQMAMVGCPIAAVAPWLMSLSATVAGDCSCPDAAARAAAAALFSLPGACKFVDLC